MESAIINGVPLAVPGRYAIEISVCQEMGWTYMDLMNTPADMVDEIVIRMNAHGKAERLRHSIQEQKARQSKGKK